MIANETLEMRGMHRKDIMIYFMGIDVIFTEPNLFIGEDWEVTVNEERIIKIGSLYIPSTVVEFKGESNKLTTALTEFRLRFLSAGG